MFALRRPRRIEQALLGDEHIRPLRVPALPGSAFTGRDLLEGSAEVHRARARTCLGAPGDGPVERPVELEEPRPVAVAGKPAAIAARQRVSGDARELLR